MDQPPTILIVSRNNKARESRTIRRILGELEARGFALHWFESDYIRSYARITEAIERRWPRLAFSHPRGHRLHRRLPRIAIRLALTACDPSRYEHLYTALKGQAANDARQLRKLLDAMPARAVHFVTHSAGGVSATHVAHHPKVARIACFGYPFRHPERAPEAYRTAHLAALPKPMLVLQGQGDPYGSDPAQFGRYLPHHAEVVSLACDHDCDRLSPHEYARARQAVAAFLGLEERRRVAA